jgi:hypothetical protein
MMSRFRSLADSALLAATLIGGGLGLYLAAPRERMRPVYHPRACHACSASAPAAVLGARDAHLARVGAIEIVTHEQMEVRRGVWTPSVRRGSCAQPGRLSGPRLSATARWESSPAR